MNKRKLLKVKWSKIIPGLDDKQRNSVEIVFKIFTGIAFLIVLLNGISQYKTSEERQFKKEFYKAQIEVLEEMVDVTSELAYLAEIIDLNEAYNKRYESLIDTFFVFYRGKYKLYTTDAQIESTLLDIAVTLRRDRINYKGDISEELRKFSNKLALRSSYVVHDLTNIEK